MVGLQMVEYETDVLVVGAGPTGLGAATRLDQHKSAEWMLIDKADEAAGLSCTDVTEEGFLFDMGGHVIFSHFVYFDELVQDALGRFEDKKKWVEHQRVSYVRYKQAWVPYPFQNNLTCLPVEDQVLAINGMVEARVKAAQEPEKKPKDFDEWILANMGTGIADIFMRPYNFKVWAVPTTEMQCKWLGERVAVVNTERAITNVLMKKEDHGWGPNATFRFPREGGTAAIWKAVAARLPQERLHFRTKVLSIDPDEQVVRVEKVDSGEQYTIRYKQMISTVPLDLTLRMLENLPESERANCERWAADLSHSSTHVIGIGIRGVNPHDTKCWLYFPEDDCPFYRATVFSHYAPGNTPDDDKLLPTLRLAKSDDPDLIENKSPRPGPWWSLMFEVSESSKFKPVNYDTIVEETIQGAIATALLPQDAEIVSIFYRRLEHGYPTPSLKRDGVLEKALPFLRDRAKIWSRGRFGAYKYEVANQDHSCVMGVETVDNILLDTPERILNSPSEVNANTGSRINTEPRFNI